MSAQSNFKIIKPQEPKVLLLELIRREQISPNFVRLTFTGDGLENFKYQGFDQWFRLFLQREGQEAFKLPTQTSSLWYAQYLLTAKELRPIIRNYTVRAYRQDPAELDVDFVTHISSEHPAPASNFAISAPLGSKVGLLDQGVGYNPRTEHDWSLLVSDETGLPAVAGVLASLPAESKGIAVIELPSQADKQEIQKPKRFELIWLDREDSPETVPGKKALEFVSSLELPTEAAYGYLVGESDLVTGLRRHLVNDRNWAKTSIDFIGYWKDGIPGRS